MKNGTMIAGAIVLAGALVAGALLYDGGGQTADVRDFVQDRAELPVPAPNEDDHIIGSLDAPITIIEYSDFECSFCARAHPRFKELVEMYEGDVAWVYRHFPLNIHPNAEDAAEASECVAELLGNDAFWTYGDSLFAEQRNLNETTYVRLAADLGADTEAFEACLASDRHVARVQSDLEDVLQAGGRGTPFSVLVSENGFVPVSGALQIEDFIEVIEAL